MTTKYVYTKKAEERAKQQGHIRKAGTAASFGFQPLEKNPTIRAAWMEAGYIAELKTVMICDDAFISAFELYRTATPNGLKNYIALNALNCPVELDPAQYELIATSDDMTISEAREKADIVFYASEIEQNVLRAKEDTRCTL